jgi:hypothetical protein
LFKKDRNLLRLIDAALRFEPGNQRTRRRLLFPKSALAVHFARLHDPTYEFVGRDWLVQKLYANARNARRDCWVAPAGKHDGGRSVALRMQTLEKIKSGHAGHVVVDKQAISLLPRAGEVILGGGVLAGVVALCFEQRLGRIANRVIVINDVDHWGHDYLMLLSH